MYSIDYDAELTKAGGKVRGGRARVRFLAYRYPLGAVGAAIMAVFVIAALFADFIKRTAASQH